MVHLQFHLENKKCSKFSVVLSWFCHQLLKKLHAKFCVIAEPYEFQIQDIGLELLLVLLQYPSKFQTKIIASKHLFY